MGQSSPINSEWKTGCIGQSTGTEEQVRKEHARIDKTGTFQSDSIFRAKGLQFQALTENYFFTILTSSTLAFGWIR